MPTNTQTIQSALEKFRALAREHMKEEGCRWAEACLEIKKRYPEARAAFGAPPAEPKA